LAHTPADRQPWPIARPCPNQRCPYDRTMAQRVCIPPAAFGQAGGRHALLLTRLRNNQSAFECSVFLDNWNRLQTTARCLCNPALRQFRRNREYGLELCGESMRLDLQPIRICIPDLETRSD